MLRHARVCGYNDGERGNLTVKVQTVIEDVLIATGVTISLLDIQQILSIILLMFNVCWILVKFGLKIYEHIKNKNVKAIADDIKETTDELEDLNGKIKDSNKDK